MHIRFACIATLIIATLLTAFPAQAAVDRPRPPNIVLIVSDDQRADTIAALGNRIIQTPNLDRLVKQGTTFTRAHAAHPICVPSRAELLTGTTAFANGTLLPTGKLDGSLVTLPESLKAAGYHTWYVGKWHTRGRPSEHGYADTLGLFSGGGGKYWKDTVDHKGMAVTGYKGWVFQDDAGKIEPEKGVGLTPDISETFADAAIQFIDRKPGKPFFLHVNFTAPHDPLLEPTRYRDHYDPETIPLPPSFQPRHPFDHGNFDGRDEQMLPWPRTPEAVRKNLAVYYAVIAHLDEQIGRITAALDKTGQRDNTVIIFTSDHGLALGSHGLMGKQNMYDHTVRVPMIFSGPGIPAGEQRDALCYLRDLYPTICDLAGAKTPDTVDARSLAPVIDGKQDQVHEQLFCYFFDSQRMIRDERWKLIHYPKIDRYQLFDLEKDPQEMNDLLASPEHRERLQAMQAQLRAWQKRVKDPVLNP